jgi:DNA-directed RNA polymerase alpha subunit
MQLDTTVICKFRLLCTERWDNLIPISGDPEKRFCVACMSDVYLTSNYEEFQSNVKEKRCVAIFLKNSDGSPSELMGEVSLDGRIYDPIITMKIEALELSNKISSILMSKKILLVGDLAILTREEITKNIGIKKVDLAEILEALASRGLTLGLRLSNWVIESERYR